jgi:hypothetical protein
MTFGESKILPQAINNYKNFKTSPVGSTTHAWLIFFYLLSDYRLGESPQSSSDSLPIINSDPQLLTII